MLSEEILARLMGRVVKAENGCWSWTGAKSRGYGVAAIDRKGKLVHRLLYEHFVAPIPAGLQLDHMCHNNDPDCTVWAECLHRSCVNPAHMQPATSRENNLRSKGHSAVNIRKTHCPKGHAYEGHNLYVDKVGRRHCRKCSEAAKQRHHEKNGGPAAYMREYRARRKAAQETE